MHPTLTHLIATLGATITDIDLDNLDETTWSIVKDAFHEYAALVFPNQHLTEEAQIAFANRFGKIQILRGNTEMKAENISSQRPDGSILQPDEHRHKTSRGNEGQHSDSSYMPLATKASVLAAITVPSSGGETAVADMRAAYDALDQE